MFKCLTTVVFFVGHSPPELRLYFTCLHLPATEWQRALTSPKQQTWWRLVRAAPVNHPVDLATHASLNNCTFFFKQLPIKKSGNRGNGDESSIWYHEGLNPFTSITSTTSTYPVQGHKWGEPEVNPCWLAVGGLRHRDKYLVTLTLTSKVTS